MRFEGVQKSLMTIRRKNLAQILYYLWTSITSPSWYVPWHNWVIRITLKSISFNQGKEFRERRVGQTLKKKNWHIRKKSQGSTFGNYPIFRNCFQGAIKSNLLCKKGTRGKSATHFLHPLRRKACVLNGTETVLHPSSLLALFIKPRRHKK